MISGFLPIVSKSPKVLILGSMPSVTSLEKQEYYGFKHNRFWKIMALYFQTNFETYEDKKNCILNHHLILWDVIAQCEREGSLDSAIHHEVVNEIDVLLKEYPTVKTVLCNGKKSYDLYKKYYKHLDVEVISLPSSSNANRTIDEKTLFTLWFEALDKGLKK